MPTKLAPFLQLTDHQYRIVCLVLDQDPDPEWHNDRVELGHVRGASMVGGRQARYQNVRNHALHLQTAERVCFVENFAMFAPPCDNNSSSDI